MEQGLEFAGFSNAIEVKIQPDDAEDAGDIEQCPPLDLFSQSTIWGYGPVLVNPPPAKSSAQTSCSELVYITNRVRYDRLLATNAAHEHEQESPYLIPSNPDRCAHSQP